VRRKTRVASVLALVVLAGSLTAACSSTKTTESDCAFVVGAGIGDVRTIKKVVHPGQKSKIKGDDEDFFVPCGARNFLVKKHGGDRAGVPSEATTASDPETKVPGTPISVWSDTFWTLNQDDDVMKKFYAFCRKYACSSRDASGGEDNNNFSTNGWNGMLKENHSSVLDAAVNIAAQKFPPGLWHQKELWPDFGKAIAIAWMTEMHANTGTPMNYFCGTWVQTNPDDPTKGDCTPVTIKIREIDPPPGVLQAYNASIQAQADSANRIAENQRKTAEVAAQKELADAQARLFKIPGYQEQLNHQYRMDEIKACGDAHLVVCGNSGTGVNINR
jgi:hypothetical protein